MKKEEVYRYVDIKREVQTIRRRIAELDDLVLNVTSVFSDMPSGKGGERDKFGEWMVKKDELRRMYLEKVNELVKLQIEIEEWLETVPEKYRTMLRLKYLDGLSSSQIVEELEINHTTIFAWEKRVFEKTY